MSVTRGPLYHVTTLSNFARGFDKYTRRYCKGRISESAHPNESYVLPAELLPFGVAKASRLVRKLAIAGDAPLVLEAALSHSDVQPNARTGIGLLWPSPDLPISRVFDIGSSGGLGRPLTLEDTMAQSLELHSERFATYSELAPRTLSFLPIARGCQAACPFCFSEASASTDQRGHKFQLRYAQPWAEFARSRGATRAVITGGGEPTLLPWKELLQLVRACSSVFAKTVLITNGVQLASGSKFAVAARLEELADAGLSVLAISRHHPSEATNTALMRLQTRTATLLEAHAGGKKSWRALSCRLICVLQRGGVASEADVDEYLTWATSFGVSEVCFKELYVSTSRESVYFSRAANAWSAINQVPLSVVDAWAKRAALSATEYLPWGSPIFRGEFQRQPISIAAYTEPSLFWERSNRLARSWNVMADGQCLASLEDRRSAIELPRGRAMQ